MLGKKIEEKLAIVTQQFTAQNDQNIGFQEKD
jgi:hypothetical protein